MAAHVTCRYQERHSFCPSVLAAAVVTAIVVALRNIMSNALHTTPGCYVLLYLQRLLCTLGAILSAGSDHNSSFSKEDKGATAQNVHKCTFVNRLFGVVSYEGLPAVLR